MSINTASMRLRLLALLVFICGLPRVLMAVSPDTPITQYVHTAWRLEDGLLNGAPRDIAQTKDGYIWIATETSVLRFDGVRFSSLEDVVGKPIGFGGEIWSLLGASDGSLWIGGGNHLYRWDGKTLSIFSGRGGRYDALAEDRSGHVWAVRERIEGDREGGLCRVAGASIVCMGANAQLFTSYAVTSNGDSVWSGDGRAVFRFSSGNLTAFPFRSDQLRRGERLGGITALAPDFHGGVWAGFSAPGEGLGIQHFADGVFHPLNLPQIRGSELKVGSILTKQDGTLWIGTKTAGLLRVRNDQVERYAFKDGLSGDSVRKTFEDREGDLWVVTNRGIDRFRDNPVLTFSSAQGLSVDHSEAALPRLDGSIWTATESGADILRGEPVPRMAGSLHLPGAQATSILEDRDGSLWLGMDTALYRIKGKKIIQILAEDGGNVGIVARMAQDSKGNVWISTFRMQVDKTILSYVRPHEDVAHRFVTPLVMSNVTAPDVHSGIWLLDRLGHLAHIETNKFEPVHNQVLENKHLYGLMQGPDGTLYVWCKEGLVLLRGEEGRLIADPQLAACKMHESIFDLDGALWVSGKCGLLRISKADVDRWWQNPTGRPLWRLLLDSKDGYNVNWGDFSPVMSRAPDGKLWFATASGLQMLDPRNLNQNALPPNVKIESLVANQKRLAEPGPVDLPVGTRDIEIDYTALSFRNPAKVFFRFRLVGHDKDWQEVQTRRQAFYTNLVPGNYTFQVLACNDSGVWNKEGSSLHFRIEPAWYQTVWFHLVCAALAIGLLWAAYRVRAGVIAERVELRVNERMSERMRISRELHDTLLQALQGIIVRFSSLTTRVSADVEEEINQSLDHAELLVIAGRERIKEMRGALPNDGNIASDIHDFATSLFANQGCNVVVETHGASIRINPVTREEILWIAREALINSCRHSGAALLSIQVIYTPKHFRLLMEDDGKGLPPDAFLSHYRGHFGLVSMHERASAIGGRLSIRSEGDKGTEVSLSIPGRLAYSNRSSSQNIS